jgi:HD-GYP domain-containing protein (c-di-GMP phosphodiesterase class II)
MKLPRRFRMQLRFIIIAAALLIIVGLTASLAISGYQSAEQALLSARLDDAARLGQTIDEEVRRLVDPAETQLRLLAHDPLLGADRLPARLDRLPIMAEALDSNRLLGAAYVGYPDGSFILFRPLPTEAARKMVEAPDAAATLVQSVTIPAAGQILGEWRFYDRNQHLLETRPRPGYDFDPRSRSWYQRATADSGTIVTEPYAFFTTREVGLTMARRGVDGGAVIGLDVSVDDLSTAMDRLRGTPGTQLALVAADGAVLAYSDKERLAIPDGKGVRLAHIGELGNAELDRLFNAAGTGGAAGIRSQTVEADGRTFQGSAIPVAALGGQKTYLLVAVPADELLTSARDTVRQLGLVVLTVVSLALIAGWLLARIIARPMQALAREVSALASFDFEHGVRTRSRITEVDDLAQVAQSTAATIRGFLGITAALNEETDLDRMLALVLDQLVDATGSTGGAIYLLDSLGLALERAAVADRAGSARFPDAVPMARGEMPGPLAAAMTQAAADAGRGTASVEGSVAVALRSRDNDLVGVLVLDAPAGNRGELQSVIRFVSALAGTAAVAIETRQLIGAQKAMLEGLIRLIAGAVDAKSPYTGGHCQRVPVIAQLLAEAAHEAASGPYAGFRLTGEDREALYVAAWLHDCGKVTTPEYVVDKATKLETIHNRIHEVRTRFEVLKRDAEIAALTAIAEGGDPASARAAQAAEWAALDDDFAFVAECNLGGEAMDPARVARLERIARRHWQRTLDDRLGLSREELHRAAPGGSRPLPADEQLLADRPEHIVPRNDSGLFAPDSPWGFRMDVPKHRMNLGELYNLGIPRGTLTPEERHIINDHIVQTIIILNKLPLPRHLRNVPEIAGGHHERMDGRGYPRRLDGEVMSPLARMMAIADVFEALTAADRPYKAPKTLSQSLSIMAAMVRDGHLDPDLFELFLSSGAYQAYAEAHLDPAQIDPVDIARYFRAPVTPSSVLA